MKYTLLKGVFIFSLWYVLFLLNFSLELNYISFPFFILSVQNFLFLIFVYKDIYQRCFLFLFFSSVHVALISQSPYLHTVFEIHFLLSSSRTGVMGFYVTDIHKLILGNMITFVYVMFILHLKLFRSIKLVFTKSPLDLEFMLLLTLFICLTFRWLMHNFWLFFLFEK